MVAKKERFEKIVEFDQEDLTYSWIYGLASIFMPLLILIFYEPSFFGIISIAFAQGIIFFGFVLALSYYLESREVYWRKIKWD